MFPRPWKLTQTGPTDILVTDKKGRKLFYIVGDEPDIGRRGTALFYGGPNSDAELIQILEEALK